MKKILSLILAVFILGGAVIPTTNAAKWHVSSIDKTYFEIPPDDRNLRDFVFGNQVINYKKWSDDSDSWSSMEATITANMMWYKTTFNPSPTQGLKVITNEDISTFFVVVDNSFYKPEGTFAFPIYKTHKIDYMYMYWKSDEDQNYCLYLDLENKGTEVYKIKHTCHMQLYDRDPFLLFFQVGRTGYDVPTHRGRNDTNWHMNSEENMPTYKISVTTTHKAKYKEKDYITFNVPEVFHLEVPKFNNAYGGAYNPNSFTNNSSFSLTDQKKTKNTLKSEQFLRQGNQRAFRPYSFYFEKDLLKRYDEIQSDETLKAKHCTNSYCQITSPFDYTSFFESFILSVAAQYYNSPAVVNDNTYIEAPDGIEGGGFQPLKYEDCANMDIACHARNIGATFWNAIGNLFFGNSENTTGSGGLVDGGENMGFITDLMSNAIVKWDLVFGKNQNLVCDAKFNYSFTDVQKDYIAEEYKKYVPDDAFIYTLFGLFNFMNPIPPSHGDQICTYSGMQQVNYRENSWVDIILVIMFCGMILGLFYRNYN